MLCYHRLWFTFVQLLFEWNRSPHPWPWTTSTTKIPPTSSAGPPVISSMTPSSEPNEFSLAAVFGYGFLVIFGMIFLVSLMWFSFTLFRRRSGQYIDVRAAAARIEPGGEIHLESLSLLNQQRFESQV